MFPHAYRAEEDHEVTPAKCHILSHAAPGCVFNDVLLLFPASACTSQEVLSNSMRYTV